MFETKIMFRMDTATVVSIICQVDDLNNQGIIDHWEIHKFRVVDISGRRNQCLQYFFNAFYRDINDIKKYTILWSVVNWGQYAINRHNDSVYIFNQMLR